MHNRRHNRQLKTSAFPYHILYVYLIFVFLNFMDVGVSRASQLVKSPDGKVALTFAVKDIGNQRGCPIYSVTYKDRPIVIDSRLGFIFEDAPALEAGFDIVSVAKNSNDTTYSLVYGERKNVRDHYNQLVVELKETDEPHRSLRLTFRAYDEGAAFRYTFPQQNALENFTISAEKTQFRFGGDHTLWAAYETESPYYKGPLSKIRRNCQRPVTIEIGENGPVVALGEAGLVDYARMLFSPDKDQPYTVVSQLSGSVKVDTPHAYNTPWRVLLLADNPCQLLERNDLFLNLNEPCAIEDPSWIKPGKVIRDVTLTTEGGKACVDFAAERNLQYVEFDAGWYGHWERPEADPTEMFVHPEKSKTGRLDLLGVIDYAKKRGVGIILYVDRRQLENQLDEMLPLFENAGVKGMKFGYVQVGTQQWTSWLHEAVRKAAKHHLVVDIHDRYRPTGYSRTYPNLLTQEGVRGNEHMPKAEENLTLPFTRMLAGAADATVCYFSDRIKTTHAHQLAVSVVIYSPMQFLYWYDKPADYQGEPEVEFFDHLPVVWDDTRVLHGEIGKYITMARRSGDEWYVGSMNGASQRNVEIPLTFLEKNKQYVANIYSDGGPEVKTRTKVKIDRYLVDSSVVLKAEMLPSGGQAMRIVPATGKDIETISKY